MRLLFGDGAERGVVREKKWWALVMICSWLWEVDEGKGGAGRVWMGGIDREVGRGGEMCRSGQAKYNGFDTL